MSIVRELKRRNVFRVAIAYVIIAWLIMQVGDTLAPALHLAEWVNTVLAFFLILGLPIALIFAWAYELTPEGLKKEKEVDRDQSKASSLPSIPASSDILSFSDMSSMWFVLEQEPGPVRPGFPVLGPFSNPPLPR